MENVLQYYEALVESAFLDIDSIYIITNSDFTGKINMEGAKIKHYFKNFIFDFKTNRFDFFTSYFSKLSKLKKQCHEKLDIYIEDHIHDLYANINEYVISNLLAINRNIADILTLIISETEFDNFLSKEKENELLENKYYNITYLDTIDWIEELIFKVLEISLEDIRDLNYNEPDKIFHFEIGWFKIESDLDNILRINEFFNKYEPYDDGFWYRLIKEEGQDNSRFQPKDFISIIEDVNQNYNLFKGIDKVKEFVNKHKSEVKGNSVKNDIIQLLLEVGISRKVILHYIIGNLTCNFMVISDIDKYNVLNDYISYVNSIFNQPKFSDYSVAKYTVSDYTVLHEILEQIQFMKSLVNLSAEDKREYDLKEYYKNKKLYWRGDLKDFSETFMPLIKRYKIRNNDPHDETRNRDNFEPIFRKLSEIFLVEKEKMKNSNEKYTEYLTETALLSGLKKKKTQKN